MSIEELETKIALLIIKALADKQCSESIEFAVAEKTVRLVKKKIFTDLTGYTCIIHSDEIRHIKKEHGDDVYLISQIPSYLTKFIRVEKSFSKNHKTGKSEHALVFHKRNSNNKVKIVKINVSVKKVLKLKTFYVDA